MSCWPESPYVVTFRRVLWSINTTEGLSHCHRRTYSKWWHAVSTAPRREGHTCVYNLLRILSACLTLLWGYIKLLYTLKHVIWLNAFGCQILKRLSRQEVTNLWLCGFGHKRNTQCGRRSPCSVSIHSVLFQWHCELHHNDHQVSAYPRSICEPEEMDRRRGRWNRVESVGERTGEHGAWNRWTSFYFCAVKWSQGLWRHVKGHVMLGSQYWSVLVILVRWLKYRV